MIQENRVLDKKIVSNTLKIVIHFGLSSSKMSLFMTGAVMKDTGNRTSKVAVVPMFYNRSVTDVSSLILYVLSQVRK